MRQDCQIAVHLGAHRTGTTLLQAYMYQIWGRAKANDCVLISTAETRPDLLKHVFSQNTALLKLPDQGMSAQAKLKKRMDAAYTAGQKLLLSEENLIGTMENNIRLGSLYPDIGLRLAALRPSFQHVDTFYISIRRLDEFWASCMSYLIAHDEPPPLPAQINALAASSRDWRHVIEDIKLAYPKARLVVREADYLPGNPKRQLIKALGWKFLNETKGLKKPSNRSKNADKLRALLIERGDVAGASRIVGDDRYNPFGRDQTADFHFRYKADLEWMRSNLTKGNTFLESPNKQDLSEGS